MNKEFIISTESTSDLSDAYCVKNNITQLKLYNIVNGETFGGDSGRNIEAKELYNRMRDGAAVGTAAVSPEAFKDFFKAAAAKGKNVLHISFSSALSCCFSNAKLAADEVMEEYPEADIRVIDSLSASAGQGLLVDYCVRLKQNGADINNVAEWVEDNKLNINHEFTVDDLKYLRKGGRISVTSALIGTIIKIKPVLHMNNPGQLKPLSNVRGRNKSITTLISNMEKNFIPNVTDKVFISHGDCFDEAILLGDLVKEKFGISDISYSYISPAIGSHSGPGTLALFYLGKNRDNSVS